MLNLHQIFEMKKSLYQLIFFRFMGWKIKGSINPNIKKCVFMVMPHTSWYDFYIGLFTRGITGLEMHFVGKKELFVFPLKYYFEWMGGTPLDRTGGRNKVDAIVAIFNKKKVFRMAISPEGTRKKVDSLKTGFYFIAQKANVPILPVAFDYGKKEVNIGLPYDITNDFETDMKNLLKHFKGVKGKNPENDFEV